METDKSNAQENKKEEPSFMENMEALRVLLERNKELQNPRKNLREIFEDLV